MIQAVPSGATSTSFTAKSVSLALDDTFSTASTKPVTSIGASSGSLV